MTDQETKLKLAELLESLGVTMRVESPRANSRDEWNNVESTVIVERNGKAFSTEFHQGIACINWKKTDTFRAGNKAACLHAMREGRRLTQPSELLAVEAAVEHARRGNSWAPWTPPVLADVMSSIVLDASALDEPFHSWAHEFGYDEDSIKAKKLYETCHEIGFKAKPLFSSPEWEAIREAAQEY